MVIGELHFELFTDVNFHGQSAPVSIFELVHPSRLQLITYSTDKRRSIYPVPSADLRLVIHHVDA